jgi:hypothetical protein
MHVIPPTLRQAAKLGPPGLAVPVPELLGPPLRHPGASIPPGEG